METLEHVSDLRIFLAVARHRGFSAAARELELSPGAVSKQIARLERALDAQLFERNTRHVALTPEGKKISAHAREALRQLEQAAEVGSAGRESIAGRIRLVVPAAFGRKVVAPSVAEYRRNNARVDFELDLSDRVSDAVASDFDFAIVAGAVSDPRLAARRLTTSRRVLVAAPEYLERRGTPRVLGDLKDHDCLALAPRAGEERAWPLVHERRRARVAVNGGLTSDNGEVLRAWCCDGFGIALQETWEVGGDLADGRLSRVFPTWEGEPIVYRVVRVRRQPMSRRVEAFLAFLNERWGETPPWNTLA
jgi:DNA-binding transcriptional LysR family regulator